MLACPPSCETLKSTVAPLTPGRPGTLRCTLAARPAGATDVAGGEGCDARLRPATRPFAENVEGASSAPCQRASSVSTSPRGSKDATSACVALFSGKRLAMLASAARSSRSALRTLCGGDPAFSFVWVNARLPPGHSKPSGVRNCRFSVLTSNPPVPRAPPKRPATDSSASGSSFAPSRAATSRSATSAVPPVIFPWLTSAQARRPP